MNHVAQISTPPAQVANIPERLRRWHPRFVACAVCTRPAAGFGFRDPHSNIRPRPRRWFCSITCQALYARHARKGLNMVDLTEEEHAAITATMQRVGALMGEIGWQTPLADLTEAQVRALIGEAVEGFRAAMADIAKSQAQEIPF